jgi:hypothetical protein
MNSISSSTYIFVFILIGLLAAGYALAKIIRRFFPPSIKQVNIPDNIPAKGFNVPLVDAYGGIKDIDRATVTQNFQKPRLILYEDHLVYKLIFRRSVKYSDILEVNAGTQFAEYYLEFTFKNRALVFTVTMLDQKMHQQVKDFLTARQVMVIE